MQSNTYFVKRIKSRVNNSVNALGKRLNKHAPFLYTLRGKLTPVMEDSREGNADSAKAAKKTPLKQPAAHQRCQCVHNLSLCKRKVPVPVMQKSASVCSVSLSEVVTPVLLKANQAVNIKPKDMKVSGLLISPKLQTMFTRFNHFLDKKLSFSGKKKKKPCYSVVNCAKKPQTTYKLTSRPWQRLSLTAFADGKTLSKLPVSRSRVATTQQEQISMQKPKKRQSLLFLSSHQHGPLIIDAQKQVPVVYKPKDVSRLSTFGSQATAQRRRTISEILFSPDS